MLYEIVAPSVRSRAAPCALTTNGSTTRSARAASPAAGARASTVHAPLSTRPRPSACISTVIASPFFTRMANPRGSSKRPSMPKPASAAAGRVPRSPVNLKPMLASRSSSSRASAASPDETSPSDTRPRASGTTRQPPTSRSSSSAGTNWNERITRLSAAPIDHPSATRQRSTVARSVSAARGGANGLSAVRASIGAPASIHAAMRAISASLGRGGALATPSTGSHGGIERASSTARTVRATRFTCAGVSSGYAPGPPARWHSTQQRARTGATSRAKSESSAKVDVGSTPIASAIEAANPFVTDKCPMLKA